MRFNNLSELVEWAKLQHWQDNGSYYQSPNNMIRIGHDNYIKNDVFILPPGSSSYISGGTKNEISLIRNIEVTNIQVDESSGVIVFNDYVAVKYAF